MGKLGGIIAGPHSLFSIHLIADHNKYKTNSDLSCTHNLKPTSTFHNPPHRIVYIHNANYLFNLANKK